MAHEWQHGSFSISTDPARLDVDMVHRFLTGSYWAAGISIETVRRSIAHSLPFGVYTGARQVGFARVITDYATFAYLADVFILEEFRGQGLGVWLVQVIVFHPELQTVRGWLLATADAHTLYEKVGFRRVQGLGHYMVRPNPTIATPPWPPPRDAAADRENRADSGRGKVEPSNLPSEGPPR